uniref:Uncharacterized protein n=1 Tax=Lepeophtheirus salmonis TaxID=72036 RepID=A0A0K2UI82_LEPSM
MIPWLPRISSHPKRGTACLSDKRRHNDLLY